MEFRKDGTYLGANIYGDSIAGRWQLGSGILSIGGIDKNFEFIDNKTFLTSGEVELVNADAEFVPAKVINISTRIYADCPDTINHGNVPVEPGKYQGREIISEGQIRMGSSVIYKAEKFSLLNSNFNV